MRKATPVGILIITGVALTLSSLFAGFTELDFSSWLWFVMLSAVGAGVLVYITVWLWRHLDIPQWWVPAVFAGGIFFRLLAMPAPHMICDDAARYHWDGKLVAHGMNPYAAPPDALMLLEMRTDALDERINHENVRTPYPPLAELLFAVGYIVSPGSLIGFQMLSLVAEFATWMLLLSLLQHRRASLAPLLLAAWLPLAITEGYLPGHADLLGLPFLTLFLFAVEHKRFKLAGLAFAATFMIKPLILVLAPAAIRKLGLGKSAIATGVAVTFAGILYLPTLLTGKSHFIPMMQMARDWDCNGTIAILLESVLPLESARIAAAVLLAAAIFVSAWWGRDFISRCCLAMAAVVAFSPVVFSWYLVWLVPLVVLRPDPALLAVLLLIPLTNVVQINLFLKGTWHQPAWSILVAFLPFYVLLIVGAHRKWGMFAKRKNEDQVPSGTSLQKK